MGIKMTNKGYVHIYTGDGKGKTTCAIGLAIRATGAGKSVYFARLFKSESSEDAILKKVGIKLVKYDVLHPFFKKYSEKENEQKAKECITFVRNVFDDAEKGNYDMLIIDEMGPALNCGFVKENDLADLIKSKPENIELVMTGRGFTPNILDLCDYGTEMKKLKHVYDQGVMARDGIEK